MAVAPVRDFCVEHIDETVDRKTPETGIRNIITKLRPEWDLTQLVMEPMLGGRVNLMFCCHLAEDVEKSSAVVVRVFGDLYASMMNHTNEVWGLYVTHLCGCGVPLFAKFNNGLVIGYAQGRTLTRQDLDNPKILKLWAEHAAKVHTFSLDGIRVKDEGGEVYSLTRFAHLDRDILFGAIDMIPLSYDNPSYQKRFDEEVPSKEVLKRDADIVIRWFENSKLSYGPMLADTNIKNHIYNEKDGCHVFIDCESFNESYQIVDLAHLRLHVFNQHLGNFTSDDPPVSASNIRLCLHHYLEVKAKLSGDLNPCVSSEDVEEAVATLEKCAIAVNFTVGVYTFLENPKTASIDVILIGLDCLREFYQGKHRLNLHD